jgi:hypothetical protein
MISRPNMVTICNHEKGQATEDTGISSNSHHHEWRSVCV